MTSRKPLGVKFVILATLFVSACDTQADATLRAFDDLTPPRVSAFDVDDAANPLVIGHRLMDAGEYDLALRAYTRAYATEDNFEDGEVLIAMGTANSYLGRMWSARRHLRVAVTQAPDSIIAWNNLGVVTMSLGDLIEARTAFETAFALSSGRNQTALDNLNRVTERLERNEIVAPIIDTEFALVRQGYGRYLLTDDVQ